MTASSALTPAAQTSAASTKIDLPHEYLRKHILANFLGQAWNAALQFLLLPVYLHLLGKEVFGIIALFAALEAVIVILDMGLSTTANREIARRIDYPAKASEARDIFRTLEALYWSGSLTLAVVLFALRGTFAEEFINSNVLSQEVVLTSVTLMVGVLALRAPVPLYRGVLLGLGRQPIMNAVQALLSTVRGLGAVAVIALLARDIRLFLAFQMAWHGVECAIWFWLSWSMMPTATRRPRFSGARLREVARFSLHMSLLASLSVLLNQYDRFVLARHFPVEQVGFYSAARTLTQGLLLLCAPIFNAVFPQFSAAHSRGDDRSLAADFHSAARITAWAAAPFAACLVFFAKPILLLWTQSIELAAAASGPLPWLSAAMLATCLASVPYAIQLTAGLTWIPLTVNFAASVVVLPLMPQAVRLWGLGGAAATFFGFALATCTFGPFLMHRRVLHGEGRKWLWGDTLPPLAVSMLLFFLLNLLVQQRPPEYAAGVAAIGLICYGVLAYFAVWRRVGSVMRAPKWLPSSTPQAERNVPR